MVKHPLTENCFCKEHSTRKITGSVLQRSGSEARVRMLVVTTENEEQKNPGFAGILDYERSFLTYCFGGGCVPFEPLAGHWPVPLPMP